jgi:nitrogen regulatory protein P-II 1
MKYVTCFVKPFRLDPIVQALSESDVESLVISHARGYGRQKGHLHLYRDSEYVISFLPKVKLEFVVDDEQLDAVLRRIVTVARTGRIGDGKILVQEIEAWGDF